MENQNEKQDPVAKFIAWQCPDLDEATRRKAEDNLRRYLAFCAQQNARFTRDWKERESNDAERSSD